MRELVEVIAKALVEHPEEVVVTEKTVEDTLVVELRVAALTWGRSSEDRDASQRRSVLL